MPKELPPLCLAVALLRKIMGVTEEELARRLRTRSKAISDYERNQRELSKDRAEEIVAALGLPPAAIDRAIRFIEEARAMARRKSFRLLTPDSGHDLVAGVASQLGQALAEGAEPAIEIVLRELTATVDRKEAAFAWERLKRRKKEDRLILVQRSREFRSWALCELVCAESVRAAPADAKRAFELAELAVEIAEVCPEEPLLQQRVKGYALFHLGNAQKAGGQLRAAEATFAKALPLWEAGALIDPGLLSEPRVLGLRASLHSEKRCPNEALALLDEALVYESQSERPYLLINRARALEQLGRYKEAIATLQEAAPLVAMDGDRRLECVLQSNLASNLCHEGRFEEAGVLIPRVRSLAADLGNGIDLLRTRWLEGWVAGGLGDRELAISTLEAVRDHFAAKEIAFDTALVTLELVVLYLEQGRIAEVKTLAAQLTWVFEAQGVHPEALGALTLFVEAARRETLTLGLAQKLHDYLFRARDNPDLRFEGSQC